MHLSGVSETELRSRARYRTSCSKMKCFCKRSAIQNEAKRESDLVVFDGCEKGLVVVAATTKIETRKLSEWQGWTEDNGGPGSQR